MQVKLCSRIFTEITQQMKGKTGGLIILKRSYLHFEFSYGYSLLFKLIETCSVLPLISCSSNIKPALTLVWVSTC